MKNIPESHRDLLDGQVLTLGTIGSDGRPQLSNVWFIADGDAVRMSLNTLRQKVKNLLANPAASALIPDASGMRYVEIRGEAEITPDDDYAFADQVSAKYGASLRAMDAPGEKRVVVTIRPGHVTTWGGPPK